MALDFKQGYIYLLHPKLFSPFIVLCLGSTELDHVIIFLFFILFDSSRPSLQSFSYVGTGLPGLNQY